MTKPSSKAAAAGRARRLAERTPVDGRLVHPRAPHGKRSAYTNYGCRCESCSAAWSVAVRARRQERRATREFGPDGVLVAGADRRHGSPVTYANWSCRCRPCTDAHATYVRQLRASRAAAS